MKTYECRGAFEILLETETDIRLSFWWSKGELQISQQQRAPLKMAARSSAILCSLRILVQDKHSSNGANTQLLLLATSLPVLVSTFVKQQVCICAEALCGCCLHTQVPCKSQFKPEDSTANSLLPLESTQKHLSSVVTKTLCNNPRF